MRAYFFSEFPYPFVPLEVEWGLRSSRVIVPNAYCRPEVVADLYDAYFEELYLADELGLDIALAEHHQSITSLMPSTSIVAGILARKTKRARIVIAGVPLPIRTNPLQVAEDYAMLDCLSRGRMILCMVRGVSTEMHPHNLNAVTTTARMREAHDLIIKAWTTGEPFSWEGEFFQYRYVNVWPRSYQQPHPPVWWTGGSPENAQYAADHKHGYAVFLQPFERAKAMFDVYRARYRENGFGEAPPEKLAYLGMAFTGETDEQAREDSRGFNWYLGRERHPGFTRVPGFSSPATLARSEFAATSNPNARNTTRSGNWESLLASGALMAGSPDTMIRSITRLYEECGVGHLLFMGRTGDMPTEKVRRSLELFAKEVYPAVRHLGEAPLSVSEVAS